MGPPTKQLRYLRSAAILRGHEAVVGRSDYSSVLIPHPSVSRVHASITQRDGMLFIQDLGSKHGTFVNERQVGETPVPIHVGDHIRIGMVDCKVETSDDSALSTTDNFSDGLSEETEPTMDPEATPEP